MLLALLIERRVHQLLDERVLPAFERYSQPSIASRSRESVLALASDLAIPVIDLHPEFAARPDPTDLFPHGLSGHYSEEGNRLVAQVILRELRSLAP